MLNEAVPKSLNGSRPTRKSLRDTLIGPIRTIGICLEQNLCTPHFLAGLVQLLSDILKLSFAGKYQPDFLGVTEH